MVADATRSDKTSSDGLCLTNISYNCCGTFRIQQLVQSFTQLPFLMRAARCALTGKRWGR